jgi:tRNA threonylcarbamoyladenosine biosynthesis protein TsaB
MTDQAPIVLALDTATMRLSAAVLRGEQLLAARHEGPGIRHAPRLPAVWSECLREAGLTLSQVQAVAVGVGPGSFTGLRVGLASAKALCFALKLPLVGVSSLAAIAHGDGLPDGRLFTVLDARKGQVFGGLFERRGTAVEPLGPEAALDPEQIEALIAQQPEPTTLVGTGIAAFGERWGRALGKRYRALDQTSWYPDAAWIGRLALPRLRAGDTDPPATLEPNYLRPSEADLSRARRRASQGIPGG